MRSSNQNHLKGHAGAVRYLSQKDQFTISRHYLCQMSSMITTRRFQRKDEKSFHLNSGLIHPLWKTYSHKQNWENLKKALAKCRQDSFLTVHSVVLMGTHLHILFSTSQLGENIIANDLHNYLKMLYSTDDDLLETPLFLEPIESYPHFLNTYKYIYRNPVEAGLCRRVEEYSFSTLNELLGLQKTVNHIAIDPLGLPQQPFRLLDWLNHANKNIWERY